MADAENPFDGPQAQDAEYVRADMANSNFNGVNLAGSRFFAVLTKAVFERSNLQGVQYDDVNLHGARFHNVNLSGSSFDNINLSGADFTNLNLSDTEISNAKLDGMKINGILVTDLLDTYERQQG